MDLDHPKSNETLDQIENEIRQIDQMMHAWSINRTLRYDRAHVKTPPETEEQNPTPAEPRSSVGHVFFWFNLIGFLLPGVLLAVQSYVPFLTSEVESFLLTIVLMVVGGVNLVLAAFESSRIKPPTTETSALPRSNRNSTSLKSNS